MVQVICAGIISFLVSIFVTPLLIRYFHRRAMGQEIREDGPASHQKKRGTPSMGGVAIVTGIWCGYLGTHVVGLLVDGEEDLVGESVADLDAEVKGQGGDEEFALENAVRRIAELV